MELSFKRWSPPFNPGTRLVFLHGMGGTGALWRPIAASLEDRYEILAPDQRGHGQSRIVTASGGRDTPSYTPLDYGRDILETLENLTFHPTWLIGHSMGVRSACAVAYLKPDWIQGMVLIDLGFSGEAGGGLGSGLAHFLKILPPEFENRASARTFMGNHCPDPSIAQYLMAVSVQTPTGAIAFPFDHAALIETIRAARDCSVREWLTKLLEERNMPILVLRGQKSLVWSHSEFESEKARFARFPSIEFCEVENAGHGLPFEQRAVFIQLLEDFISAHRS